MNLNRSAAVLLALALCSTLGVNARMDAQMGGGGQGRMGSGPQIAPGTVMDPAKSMDASVSSLERLWVGAANAMPADKYSFAPTAAIFVPSQGVKYDTVRTFAQLATHTIQVNYRVFGMIGGMKPDVDVAAIGQLTSKDDIVKAMAATFVFAHKAVANVTPANAFESVRGPATRVTLFASIIGHGEDEYGQAVEYLRMNGIIPPASQGHEM
jgi:hypothetical protein